MTRRADVFLVDRFGQRGERRTVPLPAPAGGERVVRVEAVGVNPFDFKARDGIDPSRALPMILGSDFAGTVESTGRRIFGVARGAYASALIVSPDAVVADVPDGLEPATAAALPTPGLAAIPAVDRALADGARTLLVLGRRGAVGRLAVPLAAARGATVVALDAGGDLGSALAARGIVELDAVVDAAGSPAAIAAAGARVRRGGRLVSLTYAGDLDALSERGVQAENINAAASSSYNGESLRTLAALALDGTLSPGPDAVHPFAEALDVLDGIKARTLHGKHVLLVS